MPIKRRTPKARDRALDLDQHWSLVLGENPDRPAFRTEQQRREAWERHREQLLEVSHAGRRPAGWWDYESPVPRPCGIDGPCEWTVLYAAGLLSDDELAVLTPEWRGYFEKAQQPNFAHTIRPGLILEGAAARRAWYRWAGIPREFIKRWTADASGG